MARRKRHRTQHELWQIVYLDFITTVMIFFFAMWAVSKAQSKKTDPTNTYADTFFLNDGIKDSEIYFAANSPTLSLWGENQIKDMADKMDKDSIMKIIHPESEGEDSRITVLLLEGHTDDAGEKNANLKLGFDRAFAVIKKIDDQLKTRDISGFTNAVAVCSYADNFPREAFAHLKGSKEKGDEERLKAARARNRRIVIRKIELEKDKAAGPGVTP